MTSHKYVNKHGRTTATTSQPRNILRRKDVLSELSDAELIKRYRLDRDGILYVTNLEREALTSETKRRKAFTPELKVIITPHYLATGKMQLYQQRQPWPFTTHYQQSHHPDH